MKSKDITFKINSLRFQSFFLKKEVMPLPVYMESNDGFYNDYGKRMIFQQKSLKLLSFMKNKESKNSKKAAPLRIFILVFALGFLIFGIYQTAIHGFSYAYWIFIYSLILFIVYGFVINRKKSDTNGK